MSMVGCLRQANTAEAIELGAFGVPWIVFPAEALKEQRAIQSVQTAKSGRVAFFGSDRFELIAFLLGKPWLGPNPDRKRARL